MNRRTKFTALVDQNLGHFCEEKLDIVQFKNELFILSIYIPNNEK